MMTPCMIDDEYTSGAVQGDPVTVVVEQFDIEFGDAIKPRDGLVTWTDEFDVEDVMPRNERQSLDAQLNPPVRMQGFDVEPAHGATGQPDELLPVHILDFDDECRGQELSIASIVKDHV